MTLPGFAPEPLRVACNSCGAKGWTFDYQHPDRAVECGCCPLPHDHGEAAAACPRTHEGGCGKDVPGCTVCRPVTIYGTAHLTAFGASDLLEAMGKAALPAPETEGVS